MGTDHIEKGLGAHGLGCTGHKTHGKLLPRPLFASKPGLITSTETKSQLRYPSARRWVGRESNDPSAVGVLLRVLVGSGNLAVDDELLADEQKVRIVDGITSHDVFDRGVVALSNLGQ